ncbi:TPA: hypothetical protein ACHW7I_000145 [Legionella pneumophila]|uniref:hypothetical protein n=1 Tax=Legionella pneumophila TaxID=446 RepID=UPI0003094986|nr:hypothetical protein [Legionella pneumophila]MDW9167204.1 hypothetical protein [Legionella pneumophila subsp. fraseri]AMV15294.1 hypothetical protein ULM_26340 [Legionella pneumophila]MCH9132819.1 hypothetical protein [Legionella pneumophila serogroup 1]MCH9157654.1 hypothetical protein [Legionella pneumophila serogroup 1]MCZ4680396.1 hypothetical protein [Legionella pneumophila]
MINQPNQTTLWLLRICFEKSDNHYKDQAYPLNSLPKIKGGILMLFIQTASSCA